MTTSASVTSVGGDATLVSAIPYSKIEWNKRLDGFGTAEIAVSAQCIPQQLYGAHPWVHELRIDVDGELAFVGPIRYVMLPLNEQAKTEMRIVAYEMSYWFAVRFARLDIDYTDTNTPIVEVVRQIATAALSPDDPNMLDFLEVCGVHLEVEHDRVVLPNDNAWIDHLKDIVGSLMHMRSHGRAVSLWCYGECNGQLPRVRADQFDNFDNLVYDGERYATDAAMFGADEIEPKDLTDFDAGSASTGTAGYNRVQAVIDSTGNGNITPDPSVADYTPEGSVVEYGHPDGETYYFEISSGATLDWSTVRPEFADGGTQAGARQYYGIPQVLGLAGVGGSERFPGVRVERTFRDKTYLDVGSSTAFAGNAVVPRSPLGFADEDTLRADVLCDTPWPITRVAPGMCTTVVTRFGEHAMQIDSVSGTVDTGGVERFSIGFNELLDEI